MALIRRALILLVACIALPAQAAWFDSVSTSAGFGWPRGLAGGRVALQSIWHQWALGESSLIVYGDTSLAYWHTHGDDQGNHKSITIIGFDPMLRLQSNRGAFGPVYPYLEVGTGLAILSDKYLAQRQLSTRWQFQDLIGAGAVFGSRKQYDVSWHYLHYSNANIRLPNQGIDVGLLLSFTYHFN